ncbi:MAG: alpha/beta hydrolase [Bacteroidales bacterium]|nr:alpha/beta hydrolase [Bacteroidales bacterium]
MKKLAIFIIAVIVAGHNHVFPCTTDEPVIRKEIVYKTITSVELVADIFYKESSLKGDQKSAIAFFHGGAWVCGNRSDFYETAKRYASKGMIAFCFQYRFADHKSLIPIDCLADAKSAIRWIRKNAREYNIDESKVIASGQSAGGHLAICTSLIDKYDEEYEDHTISSKPDGIILWSGCVVAGTDGWLDSILLDRKNEISNIDPILNIKDKMPPILAFHGTEDDVVPYWTMEKFVYEMKQADNTIELVRMENKGHFFDEDCKKHAGMYNDSIFPRVDEFLIKFNFIK